MKFTILNCALIKTYTATEKILVKELINQGLWVEDIQKRHFILKTKIYDIFSSQFVASN